jgi:thioredoxin-related protein
MRRLVVALLVAVLALTLAGCGGGDQAADSGATDSGGGSAPPPPAASAAGDILVPDRSPTETVLYAALSEQAASLPTDVQKRLDKKQPMLIYVFDKTQKASTETRAEVDAALKSYRGLIDLVAYDASRYVTTDAETGVVTVDPKLSADKEASKVIQMLEQLKIASTPTIILVDSSGTVLWRSRGYTDRKLIEKEILRATE